jgi:2-C-methyl-D-erythritol 4-phosphate cytidylyltransferase/2-C-methyl-D-erythritol 2,4-cyclodiphosphate synthase
MRVAAIILAAGRGERAGSGQPKQFVHLGDGRTMLEMSIAAFLPHVDEIVAAIPAGSFAQAAVAAATTTVRLVEGGARRQDSMTRAFALVSAGAEIVLVHDAARPYVSARLIDATIGAAATHGAAIAALPVRDTVKRTVLADGGRRILETLPRDDIYLAQTPQGFRREILAQAIAAAESVDVTDEAMLLERAGLRVHIVEGEAENVKITTRGELMNARTSMGSIGTGYDLHRLVPGRPLILAGVRIDFDLGLQGHSDADIVCHAVTDAILGAAALGDIGRMFPDTNPAWKDADSIQLLRQAAAAVRAASRVITNVDVTIIAERPKLLPYIDQMRANLAGALGVAATAVSVKGKTNEGVDAVGRGEAMACHAVALLSTSFRGSL